MSRKALVPIVLPANPVQPMEAATKQYVDGLSGGGGYTFTQDATPTATTHGQTWFHTATGDSFVWIVDGTSNQWVQTAPGAASSAVGVPPGGLVDQVLTKASSVDYDLKWGAGGGGGGGGSGFTFVQDTAPTPLKEGDTWFDDSTGPTSGTSWVAHSEVPGSAGPLNWVQFAASSGGGLSGFTFVQDTAPTPGKAGDTWFDLSDAVSGGSSWVAISVVPGAAGPLKWVQFAPGTAASVTKVGGRWRRVAALSLPNTVGTNVPWDTEDEDTHGFMAVGGTTITIPAGLDGVYSFSVNGYVATVSGLIDVLIPNYLFNGVPSAVTGWISVSGTLWMAAGTTLYVRAWQNSGSVQNPSSAFLMNLWKVA